MDVVLGLAAIVGLLGILLLVKQFLAYGGLVLGIAIVLGVLGFLSLQAIQERRPGAQKLTFRTGLAMCVLSVPLIPIGIGLITVVAGIGLLVVLIAPERGSK